MAAQISRSILSVGINSIVTSRSSSRGRLVKWPLLDEWDGVYLTNGMAHWSSGLPIRRVGYLFRQVDY